MIKLKNLENFKSINTKCNIPKYIVSSIIGDLYLIENELDYSFINFEMIDLFGPQVVIVSKEEYKDLHKYFPSINKEQYEEKDIIGLDEYSYTQRIVYLFNNGESGIIIYVVNEL